MSTQCTLAKPRLRNFLTAQIKRNLLIMMTVSISGAMAVKILIADKRKERYAEFYKYVQMSFLKYCHYLF